MPPLVMFRCLLLLLHLRLSARMSRVQINYRQSMWFWIRFEVSLSTVVFGIDELPQSVVLCFGLFFFLYFLSLAAGLGCLVVMTVADVRIHLVLWTAASDSVDFMSVDDFLFLVGSTTARSPRCGVWSYRSLLYSFTADLSQRICVLSRSIKWTTWQGHIHHSWSKACIYHLWSLYCAF